MAFAFGKIVKSVSLAAIDTPAALLTPFGGAAITQICPRS
jgi:hypothetical protein